MIIALILIMFCLLSWEQVLTSVVYLLNMQLKRENLISFKHDDCGIILNISSLNQYFGYLLEHMILWRTNGK